MNSFDFWDTLVARRFMRDEWHWRVREGKPDPRQFEFDNVIPITENLAKVQPEDLVISDYGDGSEQYGEFLISLLGKFGLRNKVIVTPGGKYEGTIWNKLDHKPAHHFGDSQKADVDSAVLAKIQGTLIQRSPLTEPERFILDSGFPSLALVCREARLTTFDANYREIELLQVDYNFPVLFLASIILNRAHPTGTLLMSSRDCYMWVDLMQKLFTRGVYWYTSLIARNGADENYHRYIQSFHDPVLVDLCGTGKTFAKLSQYPSILLYKPISGVSSIPAMITSPACMRLEQANCAPHEKCSGVTADFQPTFINNAGIDFQNEPHTAAQVKAFRTAMTVIDHYELRDEINASDDKCKKVMAALMHQYVNFKEALEPLLSLAKRDDALVAAC